MESSSNNADTQKKKNSNIQNQLPARLGACIIRKSAGNGGESSTPPTPGGEQLVATQSKLI